MASCAHLQCFINTSPLETTGAWLHWGLWETMWDTHLRVYPITRQRDWVFIRHWLRAAWGPGEHWFLGTCVLSPSFCMERQTLAAREHPWAGNVSVGSWNSATDKCEETWAEHTQHLLHPAVFPVSKTHQGPHIAHYKPWKPVSL